MAFSFVFTIFSRCHFTQTLYATQACDAIIAYACRLWEYRASKPLNERTFYSIALYNIRLIQSHCQSRTRRTTPANSPTTSGRLASLRLISIYTNISCMSSLFPLTRIARCQSWGFCLLDYISRISGALSKV